MIKKFEETGSIMDSKLPVRHRTGRSVDNIAAESGSAAESAGLQYVWGKNTRNYVQYFLTRCCLPFVHVVF